MVTGGCGGGVIRSAIFLEHLQELESAQLTC